MPGALESGENEVVLPGTAAGGALPCVRQLVGDEPQFLPGKELFSIGAVNAIKAAFATTVLFNGVDVKTVSSMLGHYSAGFMPGVIPALM